jgi:hypothetical protein
MGKRELLLILGFAVAGTLVYQLTARPEAQGQRRFSFSTVLDHVRRELRGNRAEAETTVNATYPVASATAEIRIAFPNSSESLTITGEERNDIASELHVWSSGFDDPEAQRLAKLVELKPSEAGGRLTLGLAYPKEARQRANVVLRVPSRMRISIARYSGKLTVEKTRDVELVDSRGDATVRDVSGRAAISHRGGDLNVTDVAALKLTARGTDVRFARVRGDITVQSQGGEVHGAELEGAVDIEANNTEVTLEGLPAKSPVHVTATNGTVRLRGVRGETRIDAHNAEIIVTIAQPAPVAVYADGGESMEITPPPGGYQLDAATTSGGELNLPEKLARVTVDGAEQKASAAINGGGPTLTLRATQGEIVIRESGSAERPDPPSPPPPPRPPAAPKLNRR